jgi:murein DD-endopeptidase MepM/ murein hydrolase activator NlpD
MRVPRSLALLAAITALVAVPAPPAQAASAKVAALQVALRADGLYPHAVDGIMGPWTRRGVRRFQRRHDLAVDGIAGQKTRRKMGWRGRPPLGSRAMRLRDRGWDVAALQFLVRSRGFGPGRLDGVFGRRTSNAVLRYQRSAGLAADGLAGPATLRALRGPRVVVDPGGPVRFLRPLNAPIGDGFGWVSGRNHTGLDFPAPMGTPVGAAGRGVVAVAGWNSGGYGNLVVVKHRLGFETWYAHLSHIAAFAGERVTGGSRIGRVGSTGRSTGPHLHFEVRRFGTPINPIPRLLSTVAARLDLELLDEGRPLSCRPNADAHGSRDLEPPVARLGRCP